MLQDRKAFLLDAIVRVRPEPRTLLHPDCVTVEIAGIALSLVSKSRNVTDFLRDYFRSYLTEEKSLASIYLEPHSIAEFPMLWEDEDAEFHSAGDRVVQRDFVAKRIEGGAIAWINEAALGDSIHNLIRWFIPDLLLDSGAFLLHAGGVFREGKGYVFFGQSGAGKSTSTRLIAESDPQALLLGDDAVIVRHDFAKGLSWVCSAPLGCGYSRSAPRPIEAPLAGFYHLCQDDRHFIEALHSSEGVARLLASAMTVDFSERFDRRFDLATRFSRSQPGIHSLHFKRDAGFWPLVLEPQRKDHVDSAER